jgi:hypothetical protein
MATIVNRTSHLELPRPNVTRSDTSILPGNLIRRLSVKLVSFIRRGGAPLRSAWHENPGERSRSARAHVREPTCPAGPRFHEQRSELCSGWQLLRCLAPSTSTIRDTRRCFTTELECSTITDKPPARAPIAKTVGILAKRRQSIYAGRLTDDLDQAEMLADSRLHRRRLDFGHWQPAAHRGSAAE